MSGRSPPNRTRGRRRTPSPLRLYSDSHVVDTLEYDLPLASTSVTSMSPPPSASHHHLSPIRDGHHSPGSRSPSSRSRNFSPPNSAPSVRVMASSLSTPSHKDLEDFASFCRAWYFQQDEEAGRKMTRKLASQPQSQRAPFARLQASIRAQYHKYVSQQRIDAFRAHVNSVQPGGSLTPSSRIDPHGTSARKERHTRFVRFVSNWCTPSMPGTAPFFQGLWAVMRLQMIPEHLGGAGGNLMEWEIDDAVFMESAGKEFMSEAIDVLKGLLGFEEMMILRDTRAASPTPSFLHSRAVSQPLPAVDHELVRMKRHPLRSRAPSDPFLDTIESAPSTDDTTNSLSELPSSPTSNVALTNRQSSGKENGVPLSGDGAFSELDELEDAQCRRRIWTAPDMTNEEYHALVALFPTFISQRALPRFTVGSTSSMAPRDLEEGPLSDVDDAEFREELVCGTGKLSIGGCSRSDGWNGTWWTRFLQWLRQWFSF